MTECLKEVVHTASLTSLQKKVNEKKRTSEEKKHRKSRTESSTKASSRKERSSKKDEKKDDEEKKNDMFIGVTEDEVKNWIRHEIKTMLKESRRRKEAKKKLTKGQILVTESGEEMELVEREESETESASRMSC